MPIDPDVRARYKGLPVAAIDGFMNVMRLFPKSQLVFDDIGRNATRPLCPRVIEHQRGPQ